MASRKFRFVSPGVFLKEIDNSQLPGTAPAIGPVLIGRTRQGPAMKPCKVESLEQFDRIFGAPMPGNEGNDPWRDGTDLLAESYLPYAARAYLSADITSPVTVVRLAGVHSEDALDANPDSLPGWKTEKSFGLFLYNHSNDVANSVELELGAIFYGVGSDFKICLNGINPANANGGTVEAEPGTPIQLSDANRLTLILKDGDTAQKQVQFLLDEIRNEFNTNPVATNDFVLKPQADSLADKYWLGESFEDVIRKVQASKGDNDTTAAVIIELDSDMSDFQSTKHGLTAAKSGWVIANDPNLRNVTAENQDKLFRFVAIQHGLEASKNLMVSIEDIRIPRTTDIDRFGSFSVVVKRITNSKVEVIERFDNCNLDRNSSNFVAKKIGDQYSVWNDQQKVNRLFETNPNISDFIRVEIHPDFHPQGLPEKVPFGFLGPVLPADLTGAMTASPEGTPAIAKLTIAGTPDENNLLVIRDHRGAEVTIIFDHDVHGAGTATIDNQGRVKVGIQLALIRNQDDEAARHAAIAEKLRLAINSLDGNENLGRPDIDIVASGDGSEVILTQGANGTDGNTADGNANINSTHGADITIEQFANGSGDGVSSIVFAAEDAASTWTNSIVALTSAAPSVKYPDFPLMASASSDDEFILGATPFRRSFSDTGEPTTVSSAINSGYIDHVRRLPALDDLRLVSDQDDGTATANKNKHSFVFSLEDVILKPIGNIQQSAITRASQVRHAVYRKDSKLLQDENQSFSGQVARSSGTLADLRVLTQIVKGFQMPLVGGSDGTNITEANPFNNRVLKDESAATSYAFASVERALDLVRDPELVEHNLASMPGITNETLTTKLVRDCETRADSLAIIDLEDVYVPPSEQRCTTFADRLKTTPQQAADKLADRQLNSSYGASYYPWVKIRDEQSSRDVWVPPSVVALGVMAYTEEKDEVWFAPAGFNRGGLNQGNAGVPVLQTSEHLLSRDRDTLYEANINPIASFVSEGIVIFGQKTLQSTQSALDRINVRRLLIYVKKFVSTVCANLLFEQNLQVTWNRFLTSVIPELEDIKQRFGLSDFKVVLDETTTTPDLVDRNIMYAKIFLKPARAIEFIAVDFIISRSGAEFADPLG